MKQNIEKILHNVVKEMQLDGHNISARLGDEQLNSEVADVDSWEFIFEIIEDTPIVEDYRLQVKLMFIVAYPTSQDNKHIERHIMNWNYARTLYMDFYNALKAYKTDDDLQIVESIQLSKRIYFRDLSLFEKPLSGLKSEITFTLLAEEWC